MGYMLVDQSAVNRKKTLRLTPLMVNIAADGRTAGRSVELGAG
jgi:hypothetical protein